MLVLLEVLGALPGALMHSLSLAFDDVLRFVSSFSMGKDGVSFVFVFFVPVFEYYCGLRERVSCESVFEKWLEKTDLERTMDSSGFH